MFSSVKNTEEAIEMALGRLACFEEIFDDVKIIKINGIEMNFIGMELERDLVPIITNVLNKKQAKVTNYNQPE